VDFEQQAFNGPFYLPFDRSHPWFSNEDSGFCAGAAVNFSNLQECLSFYRESKFTLYASEMSSSVYFSL